MAIVDVIAAIAATASGVGVGSGWWWHRRARLVQAQLAGVHSQLVAARHAADHDVLTGLPNRRAFLDRACALIGDPARHPLVVVVVDLDDFKGVNDEWGHAAGDEVLVTVAHRLAAWAAHGLVARLGGDEFAGVWTASATDDAVWRRDAERLAQTLAVPICVTGGTLSLTASIGMARVGPTRDLLESLRIADFAMYQAKNGRRTNHITVADHEVARLPASHTGRLSVRHEAAHHDRHSPAFASRPRLHEAETGGLPMPVPNLDPDQRNPTEVAPTDSYQPADPVWVHRGGTWRAGIVEAASPRAATVTYRPAEAPGTAVDTLTARHLAARTDTDSELDRPDAPILTRLLSRRPE